MTTLIYAIPSLIGLTLAGLIGQYLFGRSKDSGGDDWTDAGDISLLESGIPRRLLFDRTRSDGWDVRSEKAAAWVVLDTQRNVTAFSPLCTHLGCAYNWEPGRKEFSCPCHGSCFDAQGKILKGPAARPLDRYVTKLEGTRLWVGPLKMERGA